MLPGHIEQPLLGHQERLFRAFYSTTPSRLVDRLDVVDILDPSLAEDIDRLDRCEIGPNVFTVGA
jgi:hypothetical protein